VERRRVGLDSEHVLGVFADEVMADGAVLTHEKLEDHAGEAIGEALEPGLLLANSLPDPQPALCENGLHHGDGAHARKQDERAGLRTRSRERRQHSPSPAVAQKREGGPDRLRPKRDDSGQHRVHEQQPHGILSRKLVQRSENDEPSHNEV